MKARGGRLGTGGEGRPASQGGPAARVRAVRGCHFGVGQLRQRPGSAEKGRSQSGGREAVTWARWAGPSRLGLEGRRGRGRRVSEAGGGRGEGHVAAAGARGGRQGGRSTRRFAGREGAFVGLGSAGGRPRRQMLNGGSGVSAG